MFVGDYTIATMLRQGLAEIQANPQNVEQFLYTLTRTDPAVYAQAARWFATNQPQVILGWPQEPPGQIPLCAITLRGKTETDQPIDSYLTDDLDVDGNGDPVLDVESSGVFVTSTYDITTYSQSANLAVWVSEAVWWALLRQRKHLQVLGLIQQRLAASDIGPDTSLEPQFIYRRAITLTGTHLSITQELFTHFVGSVTVNLDDPETPDAPFLPAD